MKNVLAIILGGGAGSLVSHANLDRNVRTGNQAQIINQDRVREAHRSELGFAIRGGIVVVEKNTTRADGPVI